MAKWEDKKRIYDEYRKSVLLRKYYETEVEPALKYDVPFEFLYEEELDGMYKSLGFAIFKLRESIAELKIRESVEYYLTKRTMILCQIVGVTQNNDKEI